MIQSQLVTGKQQELLLSFLSLPLVNKGAERRWALFAVLTRLYTRHNVCSKKKCRWKVFELTHHYRVNLAARNLGCIYKSTAIYSKKIVNNKQKHTQWVGVDYDSVGYWVVGRSRQSHHYVLHWGSRGDGIRGELVHHLQSPRCLERPFIVRCQVWMRSVPNTYLVTQRLTWLTRLLLTLLVGREQNLCNWQTRVVLLHITGQEDGPFVQTLIPEEPCRLCLGYGTVD